MKILIVSNLYPPHYHGGYEVRCMQVAEALQGHGHDVAVLTSAYGLPLSRLGNIQPITENMNGVPVHRCLHQYAYGKQPLFHRPYSIFQARREIWDARQLVGLIEAFRPDIVNWWSMNGLAKTLLPIPGRWGIPDVHWVEHPWMIDEYGATGEKEAAFWNSLYDGDWGPIPCRPLLRRMGRWWEKRIEKEGLPTRRFPNTPTHVCFVSEYLRTLHRDGGLEFDSSEIIYGGVPESTFFKPVKAFEARPLQFLFASQITPDRGLHTVIEALGLLDADLRSQFHLSIAGYHSAYYAGYFEQVRQLIAKLNLGANVSFLGKLPLARMPELYGKQDVLIFASTRAEGFPLTMVEAMLAGCAVVTTGSGGAIEIARVSDLPLFPKNDAPALCRMLGRFLLDRSELLRTASHGQKIALQEFTFDRMMERWTRTLQRICHGGKRGGGPRLDSLSRGSAGEGEKGDVAPEDADSSPQGRW
jgi:glycogen synthase